LKSKNKIPISWLLGILLLVIVLSVIVVLSLRMEGELPSMQLALESTSLGANQTLTLQVADQKSGIRQIWVAVLKDGQETVLFDKTYPSAGVFSGGLVREETVKIPFDAKTLHIKDGKAMLRLVARDYSWRKWGHGNQQYQEQEVLIDTQPPVIDVLSHVLNMAQGGAGLVIYKASEDCRSQGVMVGSDFYPGLGGYFTDPKIYMTFIALSHKQGPDTPVYVTATDLAGNMGRGGLALHINARRFKKDVIPISDRFLNWKMPEFRSQVPDSAGLSMLELFLKVNGDLRRANYESLTKATSHSDNQVYWKGDFLRLPHSANRAGFAEFRTYMYKGKKIDEQTHLGIDLASIEQSPVPAANSGKIVFAEGLGIYGNTVVIDHGFNLFSMYSHLSHIDVSPDQQVAKGDIIGKTGNTGLAAGDHLHFSVIVHHTFVNPLEWWDAQWIHNNVQSKIDAIR
jgi:hypothetical protein